MKPPFEPPFVVLGITDEAPGALPNGTRIQKTNSGPSDRHQDGDQGTVIGSVGPGIMKEYGPNPHYLYFVVWDDWGKLPIGIADFRIKPVP
jgi:hypothetical protein